MGSLGSDDKEEQMSTDKIRLFAQNSIRIDSEAVVIYIDPFNILLHI